MYTILVGRPGIGKGGAVNPAMSLIEEANTSNVLSDRITMEYVLEKLAKGFPVTINSPTGFTLGTDSTSLIYAPELSIFITASLSTLPILADLWDAREGKFTYGTRHRGEYKISSPCLSLLAGSTSEWLVSSIPSNAVGGGFTRRVNFIYAKSPGPDIPNPREDKQVRKHLVEDLQRISTLQGEYQFHPSARVEFELYKRKSKNVDEFDDEAVAAYKSSKWAHVAKLCMCLMACESDSTEITKDAVLEAITRVEKCSDDLGMVFRSVGDSDLAGAGDRVLRFIESKGYASRGDLLNALWRHLSSSDLDVVITTLIQGGLLWEFHQGSKIVYKTKVAMGATP